jgi:hypothetical protein
MSKPARFARCLVPVVTLGLGLACSSNSSSPGTSGSTSGTSNLNTADTNGMQAGSAGSSAGSAGSSAGSAGGANGSTGSVLAAPVPCPAGALFCDNFESFAAGAPPSGGMWTVSQNNATVQVDTTRAFSGTQSVHAFTMDSGATGVTYKSAFLGMTGAPVIPLTDDKVYGRMMFYLESAPTSTVHWSMLDGSGTVPGQGYTSVYRYGGQKPVTDGSGAYKGNQLMASYDTTQYYSTPPVGPQTDCYQQSNGEVVPVGEWACAEWFFDGANNQMRFWLNGKELTDLAVDGMGQGCVNASYDGVWRGPTFSRLDVGWESYQADDARSIWIDDVVFSASQVGCPEH